VVKLSEELFGGTSRIMSSRRNMSN